MTPQWTGAVLAIIVGQFCGTIAPPPAISVTSTPELRNDVSTDVAMVSIDVTDPEGDDFTCTIDHIDQSLPFNAHLDEAQSGYSLTLSHTDPASLSLSSYTVEILCTDVTGESSTDDVIVTISDNEPPTADTSVTETVTVDVDETYEPLSVLHTIEVTDPEGDTANCTATSISDDFIVDTNDCTIRNVVDLRSLTLTSSEVIDIDVSDGINSPVAFQRTLSFINQNQAPEFSPPPSSEVQKHEDLTSSDVIVAFIVTDDQPVSLTFSADSDESLFDFDSSSGEVKLASGQSLDYETGTRTFTLQCVADDGFFQSTATVTFSVLDANDAPTITPLTTAVTVEEGAPMSMSASFSAVFAVIDEDDAVDSTPHTFTVVSDDTYSDYFFFTDVHVPVLTNARALDYDNGGDPSPPISITIAVWDSGGESATAVVEITLTDANDNDPQFVASSLDMEIVHVGMSAGTVLGTLEATDVDEGSNGEVTFSLVTADPDPALFSVQANGRVTLTTELAEDYGTEISLLVQVTDQGDPARNSMAVVTLDWNQPPEFTNLPNVADVMRDPSQEDLLLTLGTTDPEGDSVSCTVTGVTPSVDGGTFVVRPVDGTDDLGVYYSGDEYLTESSYDVTVTVVDRKGGSSEGVLTVEVIPNAPPECDGPVSASVDVTSASINDEVTTLTVTDINDDDITYAVTSDPDSGSFRFNPGNGQIEVDRDLRLETESLHEMTITLSDGHNAAVTCSVYITVTNLNEAPVFASHLPEVRVDEHTPSLTTLFTFDVTDDDDFSVRCAVEPAEDSQFLAFDDENFEILLANGQSFDYQTKPIEFLVTCTADDGYLSSSSSVIIHVFDSNDLPYFVLSSVTEFADEGGAGEVMFTPTYLVVDPDGDDLTYEIVEGGTYSDHFSIDTSDGTLTNRLTLDRDGDLPDQISIEVKVSDPSGETITTVVDIILNDVNDNPPIFSAERYVFKVGLSALEGTVLGTMEITDEDDEDNGDVDAVFTYEDPSGYFRIEKEGDQFHLVLANEIDLDYGTLFSMIVTASDNGDPVLSDSAYVDVVWNEGPNILNLPATVALSEKIKGFQSIFVLDVIDPESDQFACAISSIEPSTDHFLVVETGDSVFEVFFLGEGSLDADFVSEYDMTVVCYDANGLMTQTLTIFVHPNSVPTLVCESVEVDAQATGDGDSVATIIGTDREDDHLEYSLTSSYFSVGMVSGVVSTKQDLRSVTTDQFSLTIIVDDSELSTSCDLDVYLTNLNDEPTFHNLDATVDIPELTAAGSELYVISVTDPNIFTADIDITMTATYSYKFDVQVSGLQVTVKLAAGQELDYESTDFDSLSEHSFSLTLQASDGYLTSLQKVLTIKVSPVNEPPYFYQNVLEYHASFYEFVSGGEVQALGCQALDPDGAADEVTLSLDGANAHLFSIADDNNCRLTLISEYDLDLGGATEFTLTLIATDTQGESAEATVTVTVEYINDNTPYFEGPVVLTAQTGAQAGDTIGAVAAIDDDMELDGVLYYDILTQPTDEDTAEQYVSFTSAGKFILQQSMDGLDTSLNFEYVVRVTDGGDPPESATTTVNVVYDPFVETNTTTTAAAPTTQDTQSDDSSSWADPVVIGLLIALACALALLAALLLFLCCMHYGCCPNCCHKCCKPRPSSSSSSQSASTPVKPNQVNVSIDSIPQIVYQGRKISAINYR